jgi:dihydrofolate reductase
VTFVSDLDSAIAQSRAAAGENFVNVLGATVAAQCLDAGVLDEVLVTVTPVLLRDGTRLFEHAGGKTVRLAPLRVTYTPQVTNLWFRITA